MSARAGLPRRLRVRDDAAAHRHRALGTERDDRRRDEPRERHGGLLWIVLARDERRLARVQDQRAGGTDQRLGPPGELVRLHGVAGRVHARRVRVGDDALDVADHRARRQQADIAGQQRSRVARLHEGALAACSPARRSRGCARPAGRPSRRLRRPAGRSAASRGRPGRPARRARCAGRAASTRWRRCRRRRERSRSARRGRARRARAGPRGRRG